MADGRTLLSLSLSLSLSSPAHQLLYTLPLLLLSVPLTFAGAFLSLDRSRSFPSPYHPIPGGSTQHLRSVFRLQGGLGGLAVGYAFGLHLSTFLILLVPNVSSSAPLSPNSFLATCIISSILAAYFGGRWKYCMLAFSGVSGGALFALSLSVIIHPSRIARQVLIAVFILILLALILIPHFQHSSLRFAMSATGAFSLVLCISIFSHISAWENIWERLWLNDGAGWGTSKEKGLSAAFSFFLAFGIACDWLLSKKIGQCPDEKWDHYLANYTSDLPKQPDRAGIFKAHTSFWSRIFSSSYSPSERSKPVFFVDDALKYPPPSPLYSYTARKHYVDDNVAPWRTAVASDEPSSNTPTLVNDDHLSRDEDITEAAAFHHRKGRLEGDLEYSDYEDEDGRTTRRDKENGRRFPAFLKRQTLAHDVSTSGLHAAGTVPATPSLIYALDRISIAQQQIHKAGHMQAGGDGLPIHSDEGLSRPKYKPPEWDDFWAEVGDKARK